MIRRVAVALPRRRWRVGEAVEGGERVAPEETPIAMVHDGATTAVMMATPADLEDFGVGFSLSEGIIDSLSDLRDLDIVETELGVEVRMWLVSACSSRLSARRRRMVGATGCGLCGIESLAEAIKAPPRVQSDLHICVTLLLDAMAALEAAQPLGQLTRAVHAAALWRPDGGLGLVREDVGRHNALDKLIGAAARTSVVEREVLLLTSRVSVEMVQKAAVLGAPILCAVSAPTALAVKLANDANLTLAGIARKDGLEVFSHPHRIKGL